MLRMTASTSELMPFTLSKESAFGAQLTGVSGVDERKGKSLSFSPVSDRLCHQVEEPCVQLPTGSLANVLFLGFGLEVQVLEHEHGIGRSPRTEASSGFSTECPASVALFPGQPFQRTANRPCVATLCLLPGELGLETGANLASLRTANSKTLPADKESLTSCCRCDERVVDAKVDANRHESFCLFNFKCDAEKRFATGNTQAIDSLGRVKVLAKMVRNRPTNSLPTLHSGDRHGSVFAEREVSSEEEQGCWLTKHEWPSHLMPVGLGSSVCRGRRAYGTASHLRIQRGLSLMVDQFVQVERTKRIPLVECDRADYLLVTIELGYGGVNEAVCVQVDGYGSLDVHTCSIPYIQAKVNFV